jgi:hypothetical protein
MSIQHHRPYRVARKHHYPSTGDQLDAIWKAIETIGEQAGIDFPQDVVDQLEKIRKVKAKCPKEGIKKTQ